MSDPVSNVEIEDVLTSIRRLVSDGEWGQTPAPRKEAEVAVQPEPAAPSKFVLTPALRIVEPAEEQSDAQEQGQLEGAPDQSLEGNDQVADEHSNQEDPHGTADEHHHDAQHHHDEQQQSEDVHDEPSKPSLEDVIADLEAAVEHSHEWEDVSEDYDDDGDEVTFEASSFDNNEPYQPDAADQAFSAELDEDLASYMDDENIIDEEALRKLVAEVIRQELQGALGERITRNVRKLVRREIYRILASEDFN